MKNVMLLPSFRALQFPTPLGNSEASRSKNYKKQKDNPFIPFENINAVSMERQLEVCLTHLEVSFSRSFYLLHFFAFDQVVFVLLVCLDNTQTSSDPCYIGKMSVPLCNSFS